MLLADDTREDCVIRELEAYAEVAGCFLNEFGGRCFGHNPLPEFRRVLDLEDEMGIDFDPDRCFGNGTMKLKIPTIVKNQADESDVITIISTYEIQNGKFRMSKGGTVVYEASMRKLRALKHNKCFVSWR